VHSGRGIKFEAESTYAGNFPAHEIVPRPPQTPAVVYKNPARFDATTTNRDTYKQHAIEPKNVTELALHQTAFPCVLSVYGPVYMCGTACSVQWCRFAH
jgi:hypothetical protein